MEFNHGRIEEISWGQYNILPRVKTLVTGKKKFQKEENFTCLIAFGNGLKEISILLSLAVPMGAKHNGMGKIINPSNFESEE